VVVVVAIGAVVAALVVLTRDDRSSLDRAIALVDADEDHDGTGLEAGETLARVAQHLEDAVAQCRSDAGDGRDSRCTALAAALGYSQVLAAWVLDCTDPGRHEARTRLAAYLDAVAEVDADDRETPRPPRLPGCA